MARRRPGALATGLARLGCAALLVVARSARDPDLAPFVGPVHLGQAFLVVTPDGVARLGYLTPMERGEAAATGLPLLEPAALGVFELVRQGVPLAPFLAAVLERGLTLAGLRPGRLALAGHGPAGVVHEACARLAGAGWSFVSGNGLALALRKTKRPWELAEIRRAAEGTCAAFRSVARLLAAAVPRRGELWLEGERLRAARLRAEIAAVLAAWPGGGIEQPEGNIVAAGEEGAVPHSTGSSERVLRPGESLVVDVFPKGALFADCSRTFCAGEAPEPLRRGHATVAAALAAAHAAVRPGISGWRLQEAACRAFEAAGWPTILSDPATPRGFVHGLGHGVGHDIHELPSFRRKAGASGRLARGDVFTLEPGLYDPDAGWGVRLEDLVALGPGGPEVLTPLPYELDPRAWAR
jgi:Xaa-Pro aminopeptidase